MGSILDKYREKKDEKKSAPHEKAACVNEIISLLGETKEYNYTYWLRKVGNASYPEILGIIKRAKNLNREVRGGYITNQLKPFAVKKPKVVKIKNESTDTDSK